MFVRLMGRHASRIALEVALQTHPNAVLLAEEVEAVRRRGGRAGGLLLRLRPGSWKLPTSTPVLPPCSCCSCSAR